MLNVLIADDEQKICQLIEKLVNWQELSMEVIGTANNGIEALEKIQLLHPDIVITDIRMPGYDGLEIIRLGKETNPKTEFIIISGYRHFEYAQTAIRYGVNAYVLKPIRKDELTETLKTLGEKLQKNRDLLCREERMEELLKNSEETMRQTFLLDLVHHKHKERLLLPLERINREFHFSFSPGEFCIVILKVDGRIFNEQKNLLFLTDKIQHAARRLLEGLADDWELVREGSWFYFLFTMEEGHKHQIRRQMKLLLDEVRVQGDILKDFSVTIALGKSVNTLSALDSSLDNARLLTEERLLSGTGKVLEGDIAEKDSFTHHELPAEFNHRMSQALESLEVFSVRDAVMELKTKTLSLPEITGREIFQTVKETVNLYLFFMRNYQLQTEEDFWESFLQEGENCASAGELFDYLIRKITVSYERAAAQKRQNENRPIRVVKQYIAAHYREALTLEQVSAAAELSPAYFSTIFKKDTGMTFLEYLSKVRMDKAKQLLKETNRTVADICAAVGYSDVRYFTKSFTKYSGLKPNEYRKLYS